MTLQELILQCNRCRHKWMRRTPTAPRGDAAYKTSRWDKPCVRKVKPERRTAQTRLECSAPPPR
jgi:hypothetical protein